MKNVHVLTLFLAAACLCFVTACKQEKKAGDTSSGNPLTAPADYVGAIGKAQKSMEKTLSTTGLEKAIQSFYTTEGRFPKDLNELVSKGVINQVPPPPRGMKYNYDSQAGTLQVVPE
jgi:hypothetical protein